MRWDKLRLPNELVEMIAIEIFSTCLDEHFNYVSTLGGFKSPLPPETVTPSEEKRRVEAKVAEIRRLQKFFPVAKFCQICHQYRSMALRVLTTLFPTDCPAT
jgi:hypothetical protein